jgi:ubiquinone/menaquinone biosynthesis C-methylase UbiE
MFWQFTHYLQKMAAIQKLRRYLSDYLFPHKETPPEEAYNLWSVNYDSQPDNLMLTLDEEIFSEFLNKISVTDKIVLDIGCGTGRHWEKILAHFPKRLIGFDISEGMLKILREKYPFAESQRLNTHRLDTIPDSYGNLIISTLAIAHIENIEDAFEEWDRALAPGSDIIITDYHPEALAKGAERTFVHKNRFIYVQNHIHPVEKIRALGRQLNWSENSFKEKFIDNSVRPFYERKQALAIFERFFGMPIIYGIHLKKGYAIA